MSCHGASATTNAPPTSCMQNVLDWDVTVPADPWRLYWTNSSNFRTQVWMFTGRRWSRSSTVDGVPSLSLICWTKVDDASTGQPHTRTRPFMLTGLRKPVPEIHQTVGFPAVPTLHATHHQNQEPPLWLIQTARLADLQYQSWGSLDQSNTPRSTRERRDFYSDRYFEKNSEVLFKMSK